MSDNYHTGLPKKEERLKMTREDISQIAVAISRNVSERYLNWIITAMNEKFEKDGES